MGIFIADYDVIKQEANPDTYVKCASNRTSESLSAGEVCMQLPTTFGAACQHVNLYGYDDEMPCVLLILKLVSSWSASNCYTSFFSLTSITVLCP